MDGQRTFPYDNVEEGQYGDEPPCSCLQPQASDENTGSNGSDGSNEGLRKVYLPIYLPILAIQLRHARL